MKTHKKITRIQTVPQAVWHWYEDSETKTKVPAIGSLRYYRFYRRVRLSSLIIHPVVARPGFPSNDEQVLKDRDERALPAMLQLDAWDDKSHSWKLVFRKDLPRLPKGKSHHFKLDGLEARILKLTCLRQYTMPPSFSDQWINPENVPYTMLANIEWHGADVSEWHCDLPVKPWLDLTRYRPKGGRGLKTLAEKQTVTFSSDQFSVGFSLRRPMLTHLGWDSAGLGKSATNLLFNRTIATTGMGDYCDLSYCFDVRMISGPMWNTLDWECGATYWGGEVSVEGNVVSYRNLHAADDVMVDADFEVRPDGMNMRLSQRTDSGRETLECEAWRFLWDGRVSPVATYAMPRQDEGRTGAAEFPAMWAAPGYGYLSCNRVGGDAARLQVDSWRQYVIGWAGIVLGQTESYPASFQLGRTQHESNFEFRVADLLPGLANAKKIHPELRRNWGQGFMFRPELGGFSNNALSTNCVSCMSGVTDMAAYAAQPKVGPSPIEMARHTATMALKDGRGATASREIYQDTDPSVLNMTGRIHQFAPNAEWLDDVWPFVRRATERILSKMDRRGLVVTHLATGNYGDEITISNAWDSVNFGHYDAWSNAETYRAFRNVIAMAGAVGEHKLQDRLKHATQKLRKVFEPCFYNPKTGWLGSWRSKDGELHDYGHTCVNGPAVVYGLVPPARARSILSRMEAKRLELGADDFSYGVPTALIPIRRRDYGDGGWGQGLREDGLDGFGIFCNGCLALVTAYHYIRAMTVFGFKKVGDQMAREILDGHAKGRLLGGIGTGLSFNTYEGIVCGYEGALGLQFPALLAVAQHLGLVKTMTPEYWPDESS